MNKIFLKKIIKEFIPPIILIFLKKLQFILSINKCNKSTIADIEKESERLIVIGNGPSLNESISKYKKEITLYDCIAVNFFCETEYYQQIKPKFYLLADPAFFGNLNSYTECQKEKIIEFIDKFIKNTHWDINLIVPTFAIECEFLIKIKKNSLIHPYFYNQNDLITYNETDKFKLWDKNLINVPAQTCLNTCVWLGIFLRYKEIYLLGADSTWIEDLHVDQKTNNVYTFDSHFYGKKKIPLYKDSAGKIPVKLHEELYSNFKALKLYWILKDYADYAGVKNFNASEYSLIDAFERKKLI